MTPTGIYPRRPVEERFWAKVEKRGPDECWAWKGCHLPRGYGQFASSPWGYAHRAAYAICVGPIPEGLTIDHLCRNRGCVNPKHLEAVTGPENTRRGGWAQRMECVKGHPFDGPSQPGKSRTCRTCHAHREAQRRDRLRATGEWHTPERRARDTERARRWRASNPEKVRDIQARYAAKHGKAAA